MKKILNYFCATVLCLGLTSCSKDIATSSESETPEVTGQMTIIANTESNDTRASLEGDDATGYKVVWNTGDEIRLYGDNARGITYTLSKGAGTTKGEFTGRELSDGEYEAYYGSDNFIGGSQVYYPSSLIREAPMRATVTIRNGVATIADFKNLCGILRLDIKGTGTVSKITIMTDQYISGPYTINSNDCAVVGNSTLENFKKIELDLHEHPVQLSESKSEPFYIVLPQGDYTGLKIWVFNSDGHTAINDDSVCYKALKAGKTLSIKRSQITPVSLTCNDFVSISGRHLANLKIVNWFQLWDGGPKFAEYNLGGSPTDKGKLYTQDSFPSWGSAWRLPTIEEMWDGLRVKCDRKNTTVNGVKGKLFTGRGMYSVNSVFLPIAGVRNTYLDIYYPDNGSYICTSSQDPTGFASFDLDNDYVACGDGSKYFECSIRYVLK